MRFAHCVSGLVVSSGLAMVLGCTGPDEKSSSTIPSAPSPDRPALSAVENPVTATDAKELLEDAGPIDDPAPAEFTETESGLKYRILRASDGKKPTASDSVTVNYRGWLDDGSEFDSSYKRGEPIAFPLRGVIRGWTEGVQFVGVGGMVELWIPPDLGYGPMGSPGSVPPNATLHFIVELIKIN